MMQGRITVSKEWEWSIGMYEGASPHEMDPLADVHNPVLSAADVTDVKARFVADPFMISEDSRWYMFFEVFNALTNKGEIGLASSHDGMTWRYEQIILRESFHLSYPYIFKDNEKCYMMPECHTEEGIIFYEAIEFPYHWRRGPVVLRGTFHDSSIVYFADKWWLFAYSEPCRHSTLRLYFADDPVGAWEEHPRSPIVDGNARTARPAGRILDRGNCLIRFAQDCSRRYGQAVNAFEITTLTESDYEEEEISHGPVIRNAGLFGRGCKWNRHGMHHIDPQQLESRKWIACVDGCRKFLSIRIEY
jgi:hypothetical protein